MKQKILFEASGSLVSGYLLKSAQQAGFHAVGSDIDFCAGAYIADEFIIMPKVKDPELWAKTEKLLSDHIINIVVPSFDETLLTWAEKKQYFQEKNIAVIISSPSSIATCQDKWLTYNFFSSINIPTPKTSLNYEYPLVKPRLGRGGQGISIHPDPKTLSMDGMISQELLKGIEYTIDVFCDRNGIPVYIIPRKRLQVKDGKSINGITVQHSKIVELVKKICQHISFIGPINMQCFEEADGSIFFTEINPRIAGGMALGFAASENWMELIKKNILQNESIHTKEVKYGLKMYRYYDEVFVP